MSRGPEGYIQDAVIEYARRAYGVICKKNEVGRYFVSAGFPDYTIFPGDQRSFFIEFKAPGGKLTELQAHTKRALESKGYHVYVVDDVAKGKQIIDKECEP